MRFACVLALAQLSCATSIERVLSPTDAASALEQVTRGASDEIDPAISSDGSKLAYDVSGSRIEVMDLASHAIVAPPAMTGSRPSWLPGAKGVVFVSQRSHSPQALVQAIGVGRDAYVVDVGDAYVLSENPAVSPDGVRLAFDLLDMEVFRSDSHVEKTFHRAVAVSDFLGTKLSILASGTDPAWSPDGKRIAFSRTEGGHLHLFLVDADGTHRQQITDGMQDDIEPSWSPDGRYIAFCSALDTNRSNLFAVRADGSGLVQLTEGDRRACHPSWGRDGFIYFHADTNGRFHIWRIRQTFDRG